MSKILKLQSKLRVQWQDNNTGKYNETSYFGTEINDDGTNIIIVNASDPNFADVTIPFAAVSQPLFATITELRDDLRCTVLEKTGRLLHFPESTNIIPAPCLGLQNVGATLYWNGTAISVGQHTPNIITGVDNALTLLGTTAVLGGTLSQHTQIITNNFNFGITGNIGLTGIINLGGTSIIRGNINLLPSTLTSTSQNKTLQLANTTGALSLVNKGMYARINYSFPTLKQVVISVANGLTPSGSNTATNLLSAPNTPTKDWSYFSRIAQSTTDDAYAFGGGINLNNLNGTKVLITLTANIKPDIDINTMILGADGYGNIWTNEFAIGVGCPKRVPGVGYTEAVFCPANQITRLESQFVFDMTSGNGALLNRGGLAIYRNTGIAGTDALSATITMLEASMTFQQL